VCPGCEQIRARLRARLEAEGQSQRAIDVLLSQATCVDCIRARHLVRWDDD
jgi:hypothetical protein